LTLTLLVTTGGIEMNQPQNILPDGTTVRTHAALGLTTGMIVPHENLRRRQPDAVGRVTGVVPGHGGDVYWIDHGDLQAPYCFDEFELEPG